MKIGFVLDDRLDKPDGVQQYVKTVSSWLLDHGHEVHFLVGESPNATEKNVHNLSKTITVKFNKNRMGIPLPANKRKIRELLERVQFDVLHVQMPYSPLLAGRVVRAAGKNTAVVGTFHILPHGPLSSGGTKVLGAVLAHNKRRFDAFVSVTDAARRFADSHFGIKSAVLPNAIELAKFETGIPYKRYADKQNIVFLGRLVARKGAPYLLNAYKKLLNDHPDLAWSTRLIICGDGAERLSLEETADRIIKKTGAEIIFTGFIEELDKPDFLASAAIAAYPSTGGESFGIVLIEGMGAHAGVVIGGDNPGYRSVLETLPETLFDPHDTNQFANLLKKLLTDTELANNLQKDQQKLVKQYNIETVGPKILKLYELALAKRLKKRDT